MSTILDRFRLDGRVAVVTGASAGLGVVESVSLAEAGADVVIAARRADELESTRLLVEKTGRRCLAVATDIAVPEDCQRLIDETMAEFGRVDVLVNNAGIGTSVNALEETVEGFDRVLDINVRGTFLCAQAAARVMEPGSSIINITSIMAWLSVGAPQAAYMASKAGVVGLTRDLAVEWTARRGIRVNAIAPGFFRTELTDHMFDALIAAESKHLPARRGGELWELAAAVVFLASDASGYVTGECLTVDGGRSLR